MWHAAGHREPMWGLSRNLRRYAKARVAIARNDIAATTTTTSQRTGERASTPGININKAESDAFASHAPRALLLPARARARAMCDVCV